MLRAMILGSLALLLLGCDGGRNRSPAMSINAAPTITAIADQSVSANSASASITFTVADDTTPAGDLQVSATSEDSDLVADTGLALSGSGADRSLVVAPVAERIGTTTITVEVRDAAGAVAQTSFGLAVTPIVTSFDQFVREVFTDDANGMPRQINVLDFNQDADNFDDLVN